MTRAHLVTATNEGLPLTLADLAQFLADLSAAGVPATAVPQVSWLWEPDAQDLTGHPATMIAAYLTEDQRVAMASTPGAAPTMRPNSEPADSTVRIPLDIVATPDDERPSWTSIDTSVEA